MCCWFESRRPRSSRSCSAAAAIKIVDALSHAWIDGSSLRTYRHAPNAGPRKSWAAGDATSRAVRLAMLVLKGEIGYPSALTAPKWGFYDVSFKGQPFKFQRGYGSYVMENVLFKISFPAEFHAQTAVEAAVTLHPTGRRAAGCRSIEIVMTTHESAIRIISKTGALNNPADRDHCLQYMAAIGLLKGNLVAEDYEDDVAADPRVDQLRDLMVIEEDARYSREYHEPDKRSIANAIQVFFKDGSKTEKVEVEYPIGHRRRRKAGIPILVDKFRRNLLTRFPARRTAQIIELCADQKRLEVDASERVHGSVRDLNDVERIEGGVMTALVRRRWSSALCGTALLRSNRSTRSPTTDHPESPARRRRNSRCRLPAGG